FTTLGEMSLELRRDMPASLAYYQKALDIHRRLSQRTLGDKLDPVKVKQEYAEAFTRVGVTFLRLGEPQKARGYFRDALRLREQLAEAAPADPMARLGVARSCNALGEVDFRGRDWSSAREQYARALAVCEEVHAAHPKNLRFEWELANTLGNF